MGAASFVTPEYEAKTAKEAFNDAVREARYNYGHAGYTGTIAEQDNFIMLPLIEGMDAIESGWEYTHRDERIDDKWGPAGCIQTDTGFVFFGWASC